jgi:hypothetical protein
LVYRARGLLAAHPLNHRNFERGWAPPRAAVMLAPENPSLYRVLAGLLSGQGRPGDAIPWRLSGIARAGEAAPWSSWFWLAGDYAAVGDRTRARVALDSARVRAFSPEARAAIATRLREVDQGAGVGAGGETGSVTLDEPGV